ncbi:hypothetical protein I215_01040 [Galbibacter marinus]|uniref:Uncharacterized protein n=1 Tax=Galbibacter marinus TaxID=555500 RepID=K2Q7C0_9FLAO|nr:hypothetical protein [Galbibacter marinus]EKF56756.1 hypothetical protein I215_01040 [Galbibacter marinus]
MNDQIPSNQRPNNTNSEEIDLGQLFKLIGDGFRKLFNFIGSIFNGIFVGIISFLIFIQQHFIKFVIAGVVGVALGTALDITKEPVYVSTMVVEPNFQSAQQLYNNINFYNELTRAEDSVALAESLGIEVSEAASIKEFAIESYSDENQKVRLFDEFIRTLDTTTRKAIDMEVFLENFNSFDAKYHNIIVKATNSMVAKKLQGPIISSISFNQYFLKLKNTQTENIELQREVLARQTAEIDSLQLLYKNVMIKEADKPLQGTSISLGDKGIAQQSRELELITKIDQIKSEMVELNQLEASKSNILNVISDFPRRGVEAKGFFTKYKFVIPLLLIGLLLFALSILELNKFLKQYTSVHLEEKKKKS